ncbi:hypothetical protein EHH44_19265 [Mycolicibacter terrae]|uniref:Uncharacterized protein n=1 Tax=Mycolicibacter terrae TaxID=1788 RepID=A0ACD2EIF7_9MYCO|nr:hypothetical protein [Mycolicibacter terrae]RRR41155.1 hypothetical protein EHH44_19265 [Mycolicibacter terrae]
MTNQLEEAVYRAAEYGGGRPIQIQVPPTAVVRFPDGETLRSGDAPDALAALPDLLEGTTVAFWEPAEGWHPEVPC